MNVEVGSFYCFQQSLLFNVTGEGKGPPTTRTVTGVSPGYFT